jgi:hypothetical protein
LFLLFLYPHLVGCISIDSISKLYAIKITTLFYNQHNRIYYNAHSSVLAYL